MRHTWLFRRHAQVPCRSRSHRLQLEVLEDRTLLSVYTVDRLTDTGAGSDLAGDLRYCITQATSGADSVTFEGPGPDQLTVRRGTDDYYRIFKVGSGTTVNISGLTIANGSLVSGTGGGILNNGTLTVSSCNVSGNRVLE